MYVLHVCECAPFRLVYVYHTEHFREFLAVFGVVDIFGRCAEYGNVLLVKTHSEVIRYLATGRYNYAVWAFQFYYVHYTLECKLVEVQSVANIVVCGYGFGVIIYHNAPETFAAYCLKGLNAAPVEFNGASYTVCSRAEDYYGTVVALIVNVVRACTIT